MRRAILFCLLVAGCGADAPARPPEIDDPIQPPAPPPSAPAPATIPAPEADTFAPPVPPMESRSLSRRCDPNYDPCVPIDSDVDCASGRGNGPSYASGPVQVIGSDVYDLDRDGDGIGCDR